MPRAILGIPGGFGFAAAASQVRMSGKNSSKQTVLLLHHLHRKADGRLDAGAMTAIGLEDSENGGAFINSFFLG
jgi:hypothetical protein